MSLTWKEAFHKRRFVLLFSLACLALIVLAFFMPFYFREVIGPSPGIALNDPVLDLIGPYNWSWTIFTLIYTSVLVTIVTNYKNPEVMTVGLATYTAVTWLRMLTMYLLTLEAPPDIVPLSDPFLALVVYPGYFVKDLFFSGHVSTMTVLILIEPSKKLRWTKIIAAVLVAVLILFQHVHYTVDVLCAPILTYAMYRLVIWLKTPLIY